MRSQARAKVGNQKMNPGYSGSYALNLKEMASGQVIKSSLKARGKKKSFPPVGQSRPSKKVKYSV